MAVALNCTQCSAPLRVDDADVRANMTTCQFCGTLLHLTEKGSEEYQDELVKRQPPEGVVLKRGEEGEFQVATKLSGFGENTQIRSSVGPKAFIGVLIVMAIVGIATFYFARNTEAPFVFALFAVIGTFAIGMFATTTDKPALTLKDGALKSQVAMNWDHKETQVTDIKQLYTASKNFGDKGSIHDLYALLDNGKRVRLYGSFNNAEVALYIEEILEVELGLFNLPVFGDAPADEHAENMPQAAIEIELDPCANCGADLNPSNDDHRRGFTTCKFCSTVTLMYAPGAEKPLLGLLEPDDPKLQFSIVDEAHSLKITDKQKRLLLTIESGKAVDVAEDAQFFMKRVTEDVKRELGFGDFINAARNLEERMAYSGNIGTEGSEEDKAAALMGWVLGNTYFDIIAKSGDDESTVIDGIRDPREAALLLTTIQKHVG